MPYSFDYIVPVVYVAENNNSYVNKASILSKDCSGFSNPNEGCEGWNFNRCPNDDNYCQPFVKGDKIYLQYLLDITKYFYISSAFINSATGEEFSTTGAVTIQTGIDALKNNFINLVIDTGHAAFADVSCWYFKAKLFKCSFRQGSEGAEEYADCLAAKIGDGMTAEEAEAACYEELCEDFDFVTTEPFCEIPCDNTVLVEGQYKDYDCNGNFYGTFTNNTASIFKLAFRVRGSVEPEGFDFSKTDVNNRTVKSQQTERFTFYTKKIPYYVVRQLAAAFNSKLLTVDSIEYKRAAKLNKNFEEGRMWIIKETFYRDCDEINFTCE